MCYLGVLIVFILLAALSRKTDVAEYPAKGGIERCFYRMAVWICERCPIKGKRGSGTEREAVRREKTECLKIGLLVLFIGNAATLFLWVNGRRESAVTDGGYLLRDGQGGQEREVELLAEADSGEKALVHLTVQAQGYSEKEQEILSEKMLKELETGALGENASWNEVTRPLVLPEAWEDYPFVLRWHSSAPDVLSAGGRVAAREEEPVLVELQVRISGEDFEREHSFYARVCPAPEEKDFRRAAQEALEEAEQEKPREEKIKLPSAIQGETVSWSEKREDKSRTVFLLAAAAAGAVVFLRKKEKERLLEKRRRQMEREYPAVVSKLTLYLGAGMNMKSAWEKTAGNGGGKNENPVYEEMRIACREMEGGVVETEAYARFGRRVRQQCYVRFVTLLSQNVKKGNTALLSLLREEALTAMSEHAASVKREGEESAARLLFPMVMIMGMVMVLIMVPAFMNM